MEVENAHIKEKSAHENAHDLGGKFMETKKYDYRAVFHYDGKEPSILAKPLIEKIFMMFYNNYCNVANQFLDSWNNAEDCPNDAINGAGSQYNQYIRKKAAPIIDSMNDVYKNAKCKEIFKIPIKEFYLNDECVLSALFDDGTKMYFTVVPKS